MKIGIQTWGSEGDIRPFAALALGLVSAGHDVELVVTSVENKTYLSSFGNLGFKIQQVGHLDYDPEEFKRLGWRTVKEINPFKQVSSILWGLLEPLAESMYSASLRLCLENDIVIGPYILYPLTIAAEKTHCPQVMVYLNPNFIRSRFIAPEGLPSFGERINKVLWDLGEMWMDRVFGLAVNGMRIGKGLKPIGNTVREMMRSKFLNLVAVSPCLYRRKPDWEDTYEVCGFFCPPRKTESWKIPDDLRRFLRSGPPPIYVTLGSTSTFDPSPNDTLRLLVDAVKLTDSRAIIQTKLEHLSGIPDPSSIFPIEYASHASVFPYCSAVVHHGGAGTTHSACRSGCPSIVVEHFLDQRLWGILLRRAGLSIGLLHRRSLTAEKLARKIRQVLASKKMAAEARDTASAMIKEDGVGRAVELIERQLMRSDNI